MFVTTFGDLEWGNPRQLREWLAAHDLKHQILAQALGRSGVPLPSFLLAESIDESWVQTHYDQHSTLLRSLIQNVDTSVYDLLTNPMTDEETFYDWHDVHDLIHQQLDQALGIS